MLHPQARILLDLMLASGAPAMHTLTPDEARMFYLGRRATTQPVPPEIGAVEDFPITGPHGSIGLRHYRPLATARDEVLPLLLFFHGGGFVIGDLDSHDTLCRELCNLSGCAVIAVDYRLGPEHRFPKAVDDCLAALYYVHDQAGKLKIDAKRIAVGGDSAGGNLAAVCALAARDAGGPQLKFQLLIYPVTSMQGNTASYDTCGEGYALTAKTMNYFRDHYIDDEKLHADWRASPLLAHNLSGLPKAFVITAGFDPLRDEGKAYADQLSLAGTPCTQICFERQMHGFILMGRVLDEANAAVRLCASELRASLNP
jgi:acetyl esterase